MPQTTRRSIKDALLGTFLLIGFLASTCMGLLSAVVALEAAFDGSYLVAVLAGAFAWFLLKGPSDPNDCKC